jgi:two-component system, NtrC family, sensor kinase
MRRSLSEALEQQTATAEILRVIGSSSTDIQPVFEALAESAARLCKTSDSSIFRRDGDQLRRVAHHGSIPAGVVGEYTVPVGHDNFPGRAALDGRIVHIADAQSEANEFPGGSERARRLGFRAILCVPLLRDGLAIGVISLRDTEVRLFTDRQVALLQTFADQAVIAIENVRLFNETKEALEQQTATSAILQVISSSPTDTQPVFEAIVENVVRLCDGLSATLYRFDGELIHLIAQHHSFTPEQLDAFRRVYPLPPSRTSVVAEAVLDRTVIHVRDFDDLSTPSASRQMAHAVGHRSLLAVPMLRNGNPIGAISVGRREFRGTARPFSDREIDLVRTFADQAVIAIENVRLFKELQEKNRSLTEAHAQVTESLEQQTATGEILHVISSSPTDIQPVFDAVAESAARLCEAFDAAVHCVEGDRLHLVAHCGSNPSGAIGEFTIPLVRGTVIGRSVLDGRTVHVADVQEEPEEFPEGSQIARQIGVLRTILAVPLMREGLAVGTISLRRRQVQLFTSGR